MDDLTLKNLRALEGHAKLQAERIDRLEMELRHAERQTTQLSQELQTLKVQFFTTLANVQGHGPTAGD